MGNYHSSDDKEENPRVVDSINRLKGDSSYHFHSLKKKPLASNYQKFEQLPKEIIYEIAINYLEIREIYQLAKCCKVLYLCLFSDEYQFWKRIGMRDGFSISDQGYKQVYINLWKQCLAFEGHDQFSNCLESQYFSYGGFPSTNYQNFVNFLKEIDNDFNQLMYVLRNPKRNIILRAYIAVYGWINCNEESRHEKVEQIFKTLCLVENGTPFQAYIEWESTKQCNLLSISFDMVFDQLPHESKQRINNLFIKTAAFRVKCSELLYKSFDERALSFLSQQFGNYNGSGGSDNGNWASYYNLIHRVVTTPEMRNTLRHNYILKSLIEYLQSFKREESIDTIIALQGSDEMFYGKRIKELTLLQWEHPRLFEGLISSFSNDDSSCTYGHVSAIGRYIFTEEKNIDCNIRERALNHFLFIAKNKMHVREVADTFLYALPWIRLKESENFPFKEFKEKAIQELKECLFFVWKETRNITFLPILRDLYKEERDRTINQLLNLKPLSFCRDTEIHITREAFRILKDYSENGTEEENTTFFPRVIDFIITYCENPQYHCNDCIMKEIVLAAEWIKPKYSIQKLYNSVEQASKTSSFIQPYAIEALTGLNLLISGSNQ